MMTRTTAPITFETISLARELARAQLELNSILSKIAEMDTARSLLQVEGAQVKTTLKEVESLQDTVAAECSLLTAGSAPCNDAKKEANIAIEAFNTLATSHDTKVGAFNSDSQYILLQYHTPLDAVGNLTDLYKLAP